MNRRLYRSRTDSVIGGVAGGVAEYLDIDPSVVRIVWAVLAIVTGGILFVLYIVMWIVVPEGVPGAPGAPGAAPAPPEAPPHAAPVAPGAPATAATERRSRGSGEAGVIFGIVLILVGAWFLLDEYIPGLDPDLLWPIALVVIGAGLLVISMRRQSRS
jgi:phage shock protein C